MVKVKVFNCNPTPENVVFKRQKSEVMLGLLRQKTTKILTFFGIDDMLGF